MSAAPSSKYDPSARGPDPGARRPRHLRRSLTGLFVTVCAFALPASTAFGEGSRELITGPDDNDRQALVTSSLTGSPANRYTVLYVYAQAGETVQLGSSAMGVPGGGNILVYPPGTPALEGRPFPTDPVFGTAAWNCDVDDPGTGVIATGAAGRAQELAGPEASPDGNPDTWVPCEYVAPADGMYPVIMMAPNHAANAGATGSVGTPLQPGGFQIAIWDITVRDASPAEAVQPGRLFSDQYYLYTGGGVPGLLAPPGGVRVFPYTRTGYEYQVDMFEHNGGGWSLLADDQGIVNTATGERLLSSFDCRLNPADPPNFCTDLRAGFADPARRYPMFLNRPDPLAIAALAAARGYATAPITPASNPLSSTFTGSGGQSGATNRGSGGSFEFTSPAQMAGLEYTLEIDVNRNGTFGDAPDVIDEGELETDGSNAFAWNGQDAAANVPACGDYQYRVRSSLAEVHFPMFDVETSGGTQIQRLSLPDDPALGNALAASYNDRDPFKSRDVTDANPLQVEDGVSSPTFHAWGDLNAPGAIGGGDTDFIDTWAQLPEVQTTGTLRLLCADPQVVKSMDPSPAVPGEDVTFRLAVTNNGPDAATDVVATDDLPDTVTFKSASQGCAEAGSVVTCSLASLAPGATHTFEIVVAVPSSVDECIENSATVTNTTPDTNLVNNASGDCFPIKGKSNISITKAASTATVPPGGGQVMYTLVVSNDGPSDDPGVKVSDPLPAGLTLVSAEPSQGTCTTANNTVACDMGTLKDGGSAQVLVTVNTTATAGCITNTARVKGAHEDPDPANNQASAQVCVQERPDPKFDLEVDKRASASKVRIGQKVTYTVLVTNNGPDAAPEAKLTDTYNAKAKLVSVKSTQGSCIKQRPITCELGRMEAGASVTVTVVIKPRETGRARNAASATSCCGTDTNPNNNMDTADIRVRKVPLKLSKVASRSVVAAGDTLSYRIRVRNPSKGQARNVKVCDRLPSGLRFVSSSPRAKRSGGQRCWTIKRLNAGKSRTFRVTVRTSQGANGRKVNRATLTGPDTKRLRAKDPIRVLGQATPVTG
jgi:uncharacterized repeat protein (TIGR01451 family)